jgi:hypothetical protein
VKDRKRVEEWADSLLDQHRTTPRGRRDEPLMVRLAAKLSGEPPDPAMLERLHRRRERHAVLQKLDTIVTLIGIIVLCVLFYAVFSGFVVH